MDDATDKSVPPAASTDASENALSDKDLGQGTQDTGEPQHDSETPPETPAGSETEGTEPKPTSEGGDGENAEPTILTPEEVAKLPPELKASYRSMNARFQERMSEVKTVLDEIRSRGKEGAGAEKPGDKPGETQVPLIDRTKLANAKTQEDVIALIEDAIRTGSAQTAEEKAAAAVAPIRQKEATEAVASYFSKYPDRSKYRQAMGKLDAATGETMTLDQLYYAVAGNDLAKAAGEKRQTKLRDLSKGNAETGDGTAGKPTGEGDIFDEIANAGGKRNSVLL